MDSVADAAGAVVRHSTMVIGAAAGEIARQAGFQRFWHVLAKRLKSTIDNEHSLELSETCRTAIPLPKHRLSSNSFSARQPTERHEETKANAVAQITSESDPIAWITGRWT